MPLRGTRVIHRRWSEHHQATAAGGMTAVGTLTRKNPLPGERDNTTGNRTPAPDLVIVADQICRVQALPVGDRVVMVAEQAVTLHSYLVAVPPDTPAVHVDDVWTVTDCHADPSLVGRRLRVRDITYGSEIWQRDLVCEDDMEADHG